MSQIDPEILALVQEVVSDPNSTLTRIPARGFSGWLARREPISASDTLLSRAEKHLVRVHREEIAHLFYQACQRAVLAEAPGQSLFFRRLSSSVEVAVLETHEWQALALAATSARPRECRDEVDLLRRLATSATPMPSGSQLAWLSLQLVSRDETRVCMGAALLCEAKDALARRCFLEVLAGKPKHLNRALSLANLGLVALRVGDHAEAWTCYREAQSCMHQLVLAIAGVMTASVLTQNRAALIEAACSLEDTVPQDHPIIAECCSKLEALWKSIVQGTEGSRALVESVWDQLPPAAQGVLLPARAALSL